MKKTLITLCATALTAVAANAQAVLGYTLTESQDSYTPLSDATVIYVGTDEATDTDWYDRSIITPEGITTDGDSAKGFDMGLTFNFAGKEYTSFLVTPFGYLYLGGDEEIEYNTFMRFNFLTYFSESALVGVACQNGVLHSEETEISYKVYGEGEDARMTIQFSNIVMPTSMWASDGLTTDFQLTFAPDGKVTCVFNDFRLPPVSEDGDEDEDDEPMTVPVRIAVRDADNFVCAMGEIGSLTESPDSSEAVDFTADVPAGLTITWNIPQDCVTPTSQPSDMTFERTSEELMFNFSPAEDADKYLVLMVPASGVAGVPEDGVSYQRGDELGEATVVSYSADTYGAVYSLEAGTDYTFVVYSVSCYGLNGPKYNTVDPLVAETSTLPGAPGDVTFAPAAPDSITLTVAENGTDDEILVIYNSYCERSNYGDHGLFGELTPDTKVGDVFPVPEDYRPQYYYEGCPMPENAGTVAYIGKPGEVTIDGLEPSTMYYISVYTRNDKGEYTTVPTNTGWSTILVNPYDGDSFNFPNYRVPYGWQSNETGDNAMMLTDEAYYDRSTGEPTRGTQIMQVRFINNRGDGINGNVGWLATAPVEVSDRHIQASFSYSIVEGLSRFQSAPYNEWAEEDKLELQVSADNGETWTTEAAYTAANHPKQEELTSYNTISADLNAYRGETVLVRLYWHTYMTPAFGGNMYVERFSLNQAEFPAVPEVTVGTVTDETAVINWVSQQTDYELAYSLKGSDEETVVKVENAMTYTIEGLEANTEYTVKVRGIIVNEESGEESFSEWSDPVDFTTADYPAVEAPEGLVSDVESKGLEGVALLSWDAIAVAEKYEVAYRLSSSTEWTYVETEEAAVTLEGLEFGASYVWKVRAFCTHDRETSYSAQARFTMPDPYVGVVSVAGSVAVAANGGKLLVKGAEGQAISVYTAAGMKAAYVKSAKASESISLHPGVYIVRIAGRSYKLVVK